MILASTLFKIKSRFEKPQFWPWIFFVFRFFGRKNEKCGFCFRKSYSQKKYDNFFVFFRAARNSPFMGPKSGHITGGLWPGVKKVGKNVFCFIFSFSTLLLFKRKIFLRIGMKNWWIWGIMILFERWNGIRYEKNYYCRLLIKWGTKRIIIVAFWWNEVRKDLLWSCWLRGVRTVALRPLYREYMYAPYQ